MIWKISTKRFGKEVHHYELHQHSRCPRRNRPLFSGYLRQRLPVCFRPGTGEIVGTTIEEQAERACQSIKAILAANGLGFEDVIKTTCFLANMEDFAAFNGVYGKYFTGKPARSCVAVKELPKKLLCEIEIIAVCK